MEFGLNRNRQYTKGAGDLYHRNDACGDHLRTKFAGTIKKGWKLLSDSIPFSHWCVARLLLLVGGKITSSTHCCNNILVVIAITFGNDYNFIIEVDFGFRYTRYLS